MDSAYELAYVRLCHEARRLARAKGHPLVLTDDRTRVDRDLNPSERKPSDDLRDPIVVLSLDMAPPQQCDSLFVDPAVGEPGLLDWLNRTDPEWMVPGWRSGYTRDPNGRVVTVAMGRPDTTDADPLAQSYLGDGGLTFNAPVKGMRRPLGGGW